MENLVSKVPGDACIEIKDENAEFIKKLSKSEIKIRVFSKLANTKKDEVSQKDRP